MEVNRKTEKLLFVGGDLRQLRAANRVSEHNCEVSAFALGEKDGHKLSERICKINTVDGLEKSYNAVVLPLPYTVDGENINISDKYEKLSIDELIKKLSAGTVVLAGKADKKIEKCAGERGIKVIDYFAREELQILNAIPTAEGAIQIAMQETPFTVHSSKCLVIGNGRIGKILAKMLSGIGARVTVAARKERDRTQIFSYGLDAMHTDRLYEEIGKFDIVFNTVPTLILDSDMLAKTNRNALIVDLASKPGGVDFDAARKMGIKVIWALSLPGKVAPDTAGDIIGKTILNILDEMEAR